MNEAIFSESPIHRIALCRINGELHLDFNAVLMAWGVVANAQQRDISPHITRRGDVDYIAHTGLSVLISVICSGIPAMRDRLSRWYNAEIKPAATRNNPDRDRVRAAIEATGGNGVTLSALRSKTQGISGAQRLTMIDELVSMGEVVEVVTRSNTRPARVFLSSGVKM
jgi:hypothetical protein